MPKPKPHKPFKRFYEVPRDLWSKSGVQVRKSARGLTGVLIVGDDTGLIKIVSPFRRKCVKIWGEQNPNRKIKKLIWNRGNFINSNSEKEFLALLSNGDIRSYNTKQGTYKTIVKNEKNCIGMYIIDNQYSGNSKELTTSERMLFTCNEDGIVRIWGIDCNKNTYEHDYNNGLILNNNKFNKYDIKYNQIKSELNKSEMVKDSYIDKIKKYNNINNINKMRGCLLSEYESDKLIKLYGFPGIKDVCKKELSNDEKYWNKLYKNKLKNTRYEFKDGKIKSFKGHPNPNKFPYYAIAGYNRPLEMWDFNKMKPIFKGKHHYHYLGYQHSLEINDIDWCKESINPYLCAVGTAESEVKLYDMRTNESILSQKISDYAITKIMVKSKKKCLISDANANIFEYDYLKPTKNRGYMYRRFRGYTGGIRDFDIHPNPNRKLLGAVGLGRYAIFHRMNEPHLPLAKIYLKQKLNCCLYSSIWEDTYESEEVKNERIKKKKEKNELRKFLNEEDKDDNISKAEDESEFKNEELSELEDDNNDEEYDKDNIGEYLDQFNKNELKGLLEKLESEIENENNNDGNDSDFKDSPPKKKRKLD